MPQTSARPSELPEADRIRAIVDGIELPTFVQDFSVRLGEFDGDPAMWIEFDVLPVDERTEAGVDRRGNDLANLSELVASQILEAHSERFPYFRFRQVTSSNLDYQ